VTESRAWRHALIIIAVSTALRLILGALVPLFPDETYYWDWSRTLAAGYFDHPPMIAFFVRAGTLVFGATPIGVRVVSILAGGAAALGIAATARELGGDEAGRRAALIFACFPLAAAGFVLATPDAPMLCAVAWTLYAVMRALKAEPASRETLLWWCVAGLTMGLAMASKFTSVLVPAAIAVGCVSHARLQNRFGERGPYVAVLVASAVLTPVLIWNYQHDWVSFKFQLGHGLGEPKGGVLGAVNRELELLGGQIGLVSPILFYFIARAVKRAFDPTPAGLRTVLGMIAAVCLAFFVFSATRRSVEANWPALAWLPAVVLLATEPPFSWREERWFKGGLIFGAALTAVVYVHTLVPILPLRADRDQVAKAFGWDDVASAVERRSDFVRTRATIKMTDLHFAAERYQDASELAFHMKGHPRVYSLNLSGRPNQYDLWVTFPERATAGAYLILVLDDEATEPHIIRRLNCCFHIDQGEGIALMRGSSFISRKRLWFLYDWTGEWPKRAQPFPWTD
jgi:4-amino-4-deoxy-L-arabinose transferase-like glycosyltransferase